MSQSSAHSLFSHVLDSHMKQDLEVLREVWPLCNSFDLKPGSVVVVAGCFTGKVMDLLLTMYPGIYVHGFDPQSWAIDRARERLQESHSNQTYQLHSYAFGVDDCLLRMYDWETDACSTDPWDTHKPSDIGVFRNYMSVMTELFLPSIDLFVMNMEGYEFTLLNSLVEREDIKFIRKLAVQWHLHHRAPQQMNELIDVMSQTHNLVSDQRPQWTYHELR